MSFAWRQQASDGAARTGRLLTAHGEVETPVFMPVGTAGTVKAMTADAVRATGARMILGNTYHLMLRPGAERVARLGGLHRMMDWPGPILTDSGGFQVFSLAKMRQISDRGVEFRSPLDGSKIYLTPKKALQIQQKLGSDIAMQLDECAPGDASRQVAEVALLRTMKWAEETLKSHTRPSFANANSVGQENTSKQALFPIVQGVNFPDLRKQSAEFCADLPVPGIAIGGLAVGESKADFLKTIDLVCPLLPENKPRYLMGVGDPRDILEAVGRGIDMFDCVIPTRLARHGAFFDRFGRRVSIRNAKFKTDKKPLIQGCRCEACQNFSRGYLRHLFLSNEILGMRLFTLHNLTWIHDFMSAIRAAIRKNEFAEFKRDFMKHGT